MRVVVPFDAVDPKTRLTPFLDAADRHAVARCMLGDVLDAVRDAVTEATVDVLATAPVEADTTLEHEEIDVTIDERPLSPAVNDAIVEMAGEEPLVVVMADLALVTPDAVSRLIETGGDVVLVPGRGVGTNALVVRDPDFRVDFHGASFLDHREGADRIDATVETVDSFRLSTDVDEPDDLVEAFVHGGDRTTEWLRDRFELVVDGDEGRVGLDRR